MYKVAFTGFAGPRWTRDEYSGSLSPDLLFIRTLQIVPAPHSHNVSPADNKREGRQDNPECSGRVHQGREARVRLPAVEGFHVQADDARVEGGEGTGIGRA